MVTTWYDLTLRLILTEYLYNDRQKSLDSDTTRTVTNLLASKFIARKDVKAVQKMMPHGDCIYVPHCRGKQDQKDYIPWSREALVAHISGQASLGHYLLDTNNKCKFFAFDVDLEKPDPKNPHIGFYFEKDGDVSIEQAEPIAFNPREAWLDRSHPSRWWTKTQLRTLAGRLANAIHTELEIPVVAYYSGNKGVHVYGLTGLVDATHAREGARLVLDSMGCWEPKRGDIFFQHSDKDPFTGYPNLSVEVFPKQDSLTNEGGLGNLMRLPLGKNLKNPKDPTFFIDLRSPLNQLKPVDPVWALTTASQWGE